jgi:hypothetical protein
MTGEITSVPTPPMKGKGEIGKSIFPLKASEVAGLIGFMEREPRVHVSGIIRVHYAGSRPPCVQRLGKVLRTVRSRYISGR